VKKVVIVVDDENEVREFVSTALEEMGYFPMGASNGKEAMAMIIENRPDLIILDVLMPRQSGIRMYRELKSSESYKDIPVIIYSGIAKRTFLRTQRGRTDLETQPMPEPEGYVEKPAKPQYRAKVVKMILDSSLEV